MRDLSQLLWRPLVPRESRDVSEETLHRILDAAGSLYGGFGITRVTVPQVAERAGVSKATVYRYVSGKQSLAELYAAREFRRLVEGQIRQIDHLDVGAVVTAAASILADVSTHPVFRKVVSDEPGVVTATFLDPEFPTAVAGIIDVVEPILVTAGVAEPRRTAESIFRLGVTLLLVPPVTAGADDGGDLAEVLAEFLAPLVRPAAAPARPKPATKRRRR